MFACAIPARCEQNGNEWDKYGELAFRKEKGEEDENERRKRAGMPK